MADTQTLLRLVAPFLSGTVAGLPASQSGARFLQTSPGRNPLGTSLLPPPTPSVLAQLFAGAQPLTAPPGFNVLGFTFPQPTAPPRTPTASPERLVKR